MSGVFEVKDVKDVCYTVEEVAKILKVTPWVVYKYVRDGRIPSFKVGTIIRIPASFVVGLLLEGNGHQHNQQEAGEE